MPILAALGTCLLLAAGAGQDLGGDWVIFSQTQSGGFPGGPGGAPPGAGARGRGGARGGDEGALAREFFTASRELTIEQTAAEVAIDDGESVLRLYPDGRWVKRANGLVSTKAEWRAEGLVAESKPEGGGGKLLVTYARTPAGRLELTLRLETRMGKPLSASRVYVLRDSPEAPRP